ncbi:C40 family peptidase [Ammoniphilus sp. YIM 78166]|uniref:C40 family peptidase n=1 Tax=Ammoniphilus sp. YIM 78166 TaxID=1644106 RepID=UPI001F0E94C5|nr:C40 family peptidase [Ammoniphilus sp. YIM 78166]
MKKATFLNYALAASIVIGGWMGYPIHSEAAVDEQITAQQVIEAGKRYMGTPYEFGSSRSNTRTFDCSDFVRQAFWEGAGIKLPTNSRTQAEFVKKSGKVTKNWKELEPGDLMFFMSYKGSKKANYASLNPEKQRITHVAIYLGDGKMLHTYSKSSGGVRVDKIEGKHWEYRLVFAGSAI